MAAGSRHLGRTPLPERLSGQHWLVCGGQCGPLANSSSRLLLALFTSGGAGRWLHRDICDVSLQAFAYQTRELDQLMVTLVNIRCYVWLMQLPLTEVTRRVLRQSPAEPSVLFG